MATEIKLPALGEKLDEGDVLDVRVKPGDTVSKGQALLEIEAEKSTVEVPSPMDGKITEVRVSKGDRVKVGQVLCLIEGTAAETKEAAAAPPVREAPKEPETRPAKAAPPAPEKTAAVAVATAPPGDGRKPEPSPVKRDGAAPGKLPLAGPATRRLARELGVDLNRVPGTAPGGRVSEEDIKVFVRQIASGGGESITPTAPIAPTATPALPDFSRWGAVEKKPLDGIRRATAAQMSLAWSTIPHVTQHDLADVTDLDAFRREQDGKGPKLTVTAFALKAAAIVLQQFPQFNASLDSGAGQLILKRYYHIGVAVDTERGLLVPVIRDVDQKSVQQLAQELGDIADKARQKKITREEMQGGTFTITNLGGIGGTAFTPIVNWPEVAILGMSRSRLQPVVRDGKVEPRLLLPLSLSYDHRVIDGAAAARFTRRLADLLEKPLLMLLHA
jgi:pyruvate dehydrogenase E2 component (dihydrolipoamide acetyltransferase)